MLFGAPGGVLGACGEQVIVGEGADLEHGKGEPVISLCLANGGEDFVAGGIEGGFSRLPLGAVVEDGADAAVEEALCRGAAVHNGFPAAEVIEDGAQGPSDGQAQGHCAGDDPRSESNEPRGPDEAEHPAGLSEFTGAALGKGHGGVLEPHGGGAPGRGRAGWVHFQSRRKIPSATVQGTFSGRSPTR